MDELEARQRARVLEAARGWLCTPYHHRAGIKGAGVDCAQLLIQVYAEAGVIEAFDTGEYPIDWMMHRDEERFLWWMEQHAAEVAVPQPGDAAVWQFGRSFSHGAIVTAWPEVIHAYRPDRMVSYGDATQGGLAGRPVKFYSIWHKRQ
ncbi:MAG: hypothetical protein AB1400_08765 [Pseudomonadota bacterium]